MIVLWIYDLGVLMSHDKAFENDYGNKDHVIPIF
jgi:hypothetical protein